MIDSMTRRGNELDRLVKRKIALHDLRPFSLDDWQHRIGYPRNTCRIVFLFLSPMRELSVSHHVFCIGKCWHPTAVVEPRAPANVVDMQVGTHYIVDVVHSKPKRPRFFSKRSLFIMFQNGRAGRGL